MSDQRPQHSAPSNLGWPLVTMVLGLLAAVTVISVTGADVKGLTDVLGLILSASGAAGGIGAWVNSTRAARQTNGALDRRMDDSVRRGLAKALDDAQRGRKKAPAHPSPRPPTP
jgi:hypothetical protein